MPPVISPEKYLHQILQNIDVTSQPVGGSLAASPGSRSQCPGPGRCHFGQQHI